MIIDLFPIHIFIQKANNHEYNKYKCLEYVKKEYEKNPSTFVDAWDADVFTTFGKDIEFEWSQIFQNLMPNIVNFSIEMGIKGNPQIENVWFNAYKKNQSQEIHDHLPGQFSGIYYISYNKEEHLPTIFINPYRQGSVSFAPKFKDTDINHIPQTWVSQSFLKVEEGDLVIFPSFLEHKVPRQMSDSLRATLSFNFTFTT